MNHTEKILTSDCSLVLTVWWPLASRCQRIDGKYLIYGWPHGCLCVYMYNNHHDTRHGILVVLLRAALGSLHTCVVLILQHAAGHQGT